MRGVSSEHGTMTPTGAVSDVSATPRVQLEVSVTKRLVIVDVWMVLRENIVTDASLVTTTSPTVRPATVIQLVLTRMLASMFSLFSKVSNFRIRLTMFRDGICQCDATGACPCKKTAVGKKCASCLRGYFGLSDSSSEGCTECFCFGRSRDCDQASYSWTQLVSSRRRQLTISRGDSNLAVENSLIIIPGDNHDVVIGVNNLFDVPIYWYVHINNRDNS